MNRPKLFDPKDMHKLNIRLPDDPNPYDSKTPLKGPDWLWNWQWWFQIIAMAAGLVAVRYFTSGGSL